MSFIEIAPAFKGAVVPADLLKSEGTMTFVVPREDVARGGFLFRVVDDPFVFALSFQNSALVFQRNETVSILTADKLPGSVTSLRVFAIWTLTSLRLTWGEGNQRVGATVPTSPTVAPLSLVKWARKQNLVPVAQYTSVEQFRGKVYSCLESLQSKIDETRAAIAFWNVRYEGQRIVERVPKSEPDIHPVVHALLSDQMLMASIDVIPEQRTGVGNLDFKFSGSIVDEGLAHVCGEFKLAHSADLAHGLEQQLPAYMRNTNTQYGAYCVPYFRGEWFDEPRDKVIGDIDFDLKLRIQRSNDPVLKGIRVFVLDVSKHETASR